jgi:hypothetical protein
MNRPALRTPTHPALCCATCIHWRCDNKRREPHCGVVGQYLPSDLLEVACDAWKLEPRESQAQELWHKLNI